MRAWGGLSTRQTGSAPGQLACRAVEQERLCRQPGWACFCGGQLLEAPVSTHTPAWLRPHRPAATLPMPLLLQVYFPPLAQGAAGGGA